MAFRSQDNIRSALRGSGSGNVNKIDYSTDNLFAGVWRLDQTNLNRFDPFIQGYAGIIWTAMPKFFEQDMQTQFKYFTERNFKSFSGINDLTLEADNISHGFAGNEMGVATNMKKENTSFTLRHYELAGSPVRELYMYWITGIRDPETGVATYHGQINQGTMQYSMKNHTGELLYVVTDPSFATGASETAAGLSIEFAAYYTNCFPTKIPQDHLNYNSGEHGVPEIDIEFRGNFHLGGSVNQLATKAMASYSLQKVYSDYGTLNGGSLGGNQSGIVAGTENSSLAVGYGV